MTIISFFLTNVLCRLTAVLNFQDFGFAIFFHPILYQGS